MLNVFVLDTLQTFLPEEKEEFRLFLNSPYFNRGANQEYLIKLLDLLLDAQKRGEIEALEKQTIYQALYPNKILIESKVDKLMSELKRQVQDFLTTRRYHLPENEPRKLLDLSKELHQRGLESRSNQVLDKLKKELDEQPWETVEIYFLKHLLSKEEHEWLSYFNKGKGDLKLAEAIRQLDNYYWALKTELLNRLFLQKKVTILSPEAEATIQDILLIPIKELDKYALIRVTWEIYNLLKAPTPEFNQVLGLMEIIQKYENKFAPERLAEFYTYLRNFCILLLDEGKNEVLPILHSIQLDNLKRGYFYMEGKILPNALLTVTQTALNLDKTDWALKFVEEHKDRIMDENESHDFYRTNKALCLFTERKFDEALEIIPFGSSYSHFHLLARRLELKIYYELDSDLLPYKIDAFKMFISRAGNKVLSETYHELHVNFVNFLRQLSLSPKIRDKTRSAQMIKRIQEKQLVGERAWLLEKARELGERSK